MLNDMYYSQGDEYKSRYRENYFELLQQIISQCAYISGADIADIMEKTNLVQKYAERVGILN